ncbi:retinitis pigmentosa 1-like 1 protein [Erpetoichthys calabaricus]|uniref:retinitis pigmentosa 1-like 1 protein n=1 Tax=Erpetoichthys calabaricus TaxID=27687 RepID=UPI0022346EF6|nr:retinitis pigmentosa 1-like 1 protein [Erpetoichthys calabaricus]XP_051780355.1 retinitis pigmentosa 1-like 1 protein [Erpetoichthys calabaricus]XP_051780356.1 retinitis pigmentosa 1-like 1 protein [Erpetoichthys calabaricus]
MQKASSGYPAGPIPHDLDPPLPPVSKFPTNVTESTPAKKITFLKSGDPQFRGVRMAIHKRSFKCFDALLDDLSNKVPLPFGVRTITTPRGTHNISRLDQLEDGCCYHCSDRRQVKVPNVEATSRKQNGPGCWYPSKPEEPPHVNLSTQRHHRRIVLVKNTDPAVRKTIVINRRTTRSLKFFLEEISELLQCPIRKLYTLDGRKIDSTQALIQCPSVLVCVGREPFRLLLSESLRKNSEEKFPGLGRSRTSICSDSHESVKTANFGLETKKSIIHPRSDSCNRSMRFSLSSEKSIPNGLNVSSGYPLHAETCPHAKEPLINDDIEKRVLVNKDGSLSVEMKVRFRLQNDETLQWSTQIRKSSLRNPDPYIPKEEGTELDHTERQGTQGTCSETESFHPCDDDYAYSANIHQNCCNHCREYDIWKNPAHSTSVHREDTSVVRQIRSSSSSASSHRRILRTKSSADTVSSEVYAEQVVQHTTSYTETVQNGESGAEYCTMSRCSGHSGSCSTTSQKLGKSEGRVSLTHSHSMSCSSVGENGNSALGSDDDEKHPNDVSSLTSKDKVSLEDDQGREPSGSPSSTPCQKEDHDENDMESSCSNQKPLSPMQHLSPRPDSKSSICSSHSSKARHRKRVEDHSEDALSVVSGLSHHSCREDTECQSAQTPISASTKKSKMLPVNDSDGVASPVSEVPDGQNQAGVVEEDSDERPSSIMSKSTKGSKKSNRIECNGSERISTPGSSTSNLPDGKCMREVLDEDTDERPVSNMSKSTKASSQSKISKRHSGSERLTTQESSTSEVPIVVDTGVAEEDSEERAVSSTSKSTRSSHKSKKSSRKNGTAQEGQDGSEVETAKEVIEETEENNKQTPSDVSGSSERKSKSNSENGGKASTCSSASEGKEDDAEEKLDSNQVRRKTPNSSSRRDEVESTVSSVCRKSVCKMDGKGHEASRSASRVSHISLSSCEVKDDTAAKASDTTHTEPCSLSEGKEELAADPEEDSEGHSQNGSKSHSEIGQQQNLQTANGRESSSSSRPISSLSSKSAANAKDQNTAEDDCRSHSRISSESSYLPVKTSEVKQPDLKCDDDSPSSVVSKSTQSNKKKSKCHLQLAKKGSSLASSTMSLSSKSVHSPCPPKGKPHGKNVRPVIMLVSSKGSVCTDSPLAAELENKNDGDSANTKAQVSEKCIKVESESKSCQGRKSRRKKHSPSRKKGEGGEEEFKSSAEMADVTELVPSALPNATPTEVVHEWLSKIPADTSLCDLGDDFHEDCEALNVQNYHDEATPKDVLLLSDLTSTTGNPNEEQAENEAVDKPGDEPDIDVKRDKEDETGIIENHLEECAEVQPEPVYDFHSRQCPSPKNNLEYRHHLSVQVMKILLNPNRGSKLDRCSSLPEVSPSYGRKLSHSAGQLLECLASLQILDGEAADNNENGTKYAEIMSILQSLWLNDSAEYNQQPAQEKTFKDHHSTDDEFNPRSSSGVDVGSGSGGSGKSSVTGGVDGSHSDKRVLPHMVAEDKECLSEPNARHDSLHQLLEENEQNEDEQQSQLSTSRSYFNGKLSNSATPDIASRVRWSHESEGIGSEEDNEGKQNEGVSVPEKGATENTLQKDAEDCSNIIEESEVTAESAQKNVVEVLEEDSVRNTLTPVSATSEKEAMGKTDKKSLDPDPVWVLNLLKKLEKQFMTHYVSAMAEFKLRWNLDNNPQLDEMIKELKEDVHKRIQASIEKELKKIRGRVGRTPRPPGNSATRQSTAQTERRRRRLKIMSKRTVDESEIYTLSGTEFSEQRSDEEYCPCDTCMKKKMVARPIKVMAMAKVPIQKEFDLREILQKNKCEEVVQPTDVSEDAKETCSSGAMDNENKETYEDDIHPENEELVDEEGNTEGAAENKAEMANDEDEVQGETAEPQNNEENEEATPDEVCGEDENETNTGAEEKKDDVEDQEEGKCTESEVGDEPQEESAQHDQEAEVNEGEEEMKDENDEETTNQNDEDQQLEENKSEDKQDDCEAEEEVEKKETKVENEVEAEEKDNEEEADGEVGAEEGAEIQDQSKMDSDEENQAAETEEGEVENEDGESKDEGSKCESKGDQASDDENDEKERDGSDMDEADDHHSSRDKQSKQENDDDAKKDETDENEDEVLDEDEADKDDKEPSEEEICKSIQDQVTPGSQEAEGVKAEEDEKEKAVEELEQNEEHEDTSDTAVVNDAIEEEQEKQEAIQEDELVASEQNNTETGDQQRNEELSENVNGDSSTPQNDKQVETSSGEDDTVAEIEDNGEKLKKIQQFTLVGKGQAKQISRSSIESLQGSIEKSIDVGMEEQKNDMSSAATRPMQMYPQTSSEEDGPGSGSASPDGHHEHTTVRSDVETHLMGESTSQSKKPKESHIDQDDLDF